LQEVVQETVVELEQGLAYLAAQAAAAGLILVVTNPEVLEHQDKGTQVVLQAQTELLVAAAVAAVGLGL
jgi:hypothetical protein